jgi:hypothetical protein
MIAGLTLPICSGTLDKGTVIVADPGIALTVKLKFAISAAITR